MLPSTGPTFAPPCLSRRGAAPLAILLATLVGVSGCHLVPKVPAQERLSEELEARTGQGLGPKTPPGQVLLPDALLQCEELTQDAAVALALWNNAAFLEALTDLGVARGDLIQAGLLPNPELLFTFSVHNKPYRYLFDFPIESLWLRPIRMKAAGRELERVRERLAQLGLDLIRDTRVAYVELWLAGQRVNVAEQAVRLRSRIAELAEARLRAGDATPQEAATARIESLQARQDLARIQYDVDLARVRLRNLLGIPQDREIVCRKVVLDTPAAPVVSCELEADALRTRPDAVAASWAVEAARSRLRLARYVWFRLLGIADATAGLPNDHTLGPGFRVTLPLLNKNQGNIARAEAELERFERNQVTLHNQILLDVRLAALRFEQARAELDVLEKQTLPEGEKAVRRAQTAYKEGNASLLVALETPRLLLDSLLRQAILKAELNRAWVELERSVGHRLPEGKTPETKEVPSP